ncbi:protein of unknown function [Serratia sp. Tan611]|nr:protein of unknown function [Serratia sp. Tan611]
MQRGLQRILSSHYLTYLNELGWVNNENNKCSHGGVRIFGKYKPVPLKPAGKNKKG